MTRKQLLDHLIELNELSILNTFQDEIRKFPWDVETPVVQLRLDDIVRQISRVESGNLSINGLFLWAEILESREDVEFEPEHEDSIKALLFKLANSEISGVSKPEDLALLKKQI